MKCKSLGIIVILLYPNSTSSTQPADKAFFKPTKALYKKIMQTNKFLDPDFRATKQCFAPMIGKMMSLCSPAWVQKGFESTVLYPLNRHRVKMHNFHSAFDDQPKSDEVRPEDESFLTSIPSVSMKNCSPTSPDVVVEKSSLTSPYNSLDVIIESADEIELTPCDTQLSTHLVTTNSATEQLSAINQSDSFEETIVTSLYNKNEISVSKPITKGTFNEKPDVMS